LKLRDTKIYGFTLNSTVANEEANFTNVIAYNTHHDEIRVYFLTYEKEFQLLTVPFYKTVTKPGKLVDSFGVFTASRTIPLVGSL